MSRYIDKDEFLKRIHDRAIRGKIKKPFDVYLAISEVQEVVIPAEHAHWISNGVHTKKCSHCSYISVDVGNFCSECGAKMDEEEQ